MPRSALPRVLWVTTKTPWPPADGGRLLVFETLRALRAAGCEVTLVAPALGGAEEARAAAAPLAEVCRPVLVPVRARGRLRSLLAARALRIPVTIARHRQPAVRATVAREARAAATEIVVAEQLQAVWAAGAASAPVVLRQQNVESDLWTGWLETRPRWSRAFAAEAARLRRAEAAALATVAATVALTAGDCSRLGEIGGAAGRIVEIPAPFPAQLPGGRGTLAGSPPVVILGSGGWAPNRDQVEWFTRQSWPAVRAELPAARLHVFGADAHGAGIELHPGLAESRDAFAPGAVLVVPLRVGSGVRMKILEAWARGVPVVATPAGAAGLEAEDGRELLVARDGAEFAAALGRLAAEPPLAAALVEGGRALLRRRHDPTRIAELLSALFEEVRRTAGGGFPASSRSGPLRDSQ